MFSNLYRIYTCVIWEREKGKIEKYTTILNFKTRSLFLKQKITCVKKLIIINTYPT